MASVSKVYLLAYNGFQLLLHSFILYSMAVDSSYSKFEVHAKYGRLYRLLIAGALLEVVHPMLGLTKGNPLLPLLQNGGRYFILFHMVDGANPLTAAFLYFVWSSIEVCRYSFYLSTVLGIRSPTLTWLRYSIWIPLYPMGLLTEATVICQNLAEMERTGRLSLTLPNALNLTIHAPMILKAYLAVGIWVAAYVLLGHMWRQRVKVLSAAGKEELAGTRLGGKSD